MAIYVRMKESHEGFRVLEDVSLSGAVAKQFQLEGKAWVTGGDPADFEAHGLQADLDVPEARYYPAPSDLIQVEKG